MKHYLVNQILAKLPLQIIFIVPFVLQIFGTVTLVGYLSYRSGQKTVEDLATQLMHKVGDRVEKKLKNYLEVPQTINQINLNQIQLNFLNLNNLYPWEKYLWRQIQLYSNMAYIGIATEQGKQRSGEKSLEGNLYINVTDDDVGSNFYSFRTNHRGERTTGKLIKKNFNPREHSIYQKALREGKSTWSDVFVSLLEPTLLMSALEPVYDQNQKIIGVLVATLRLDEIGKFLNHLKVSKSGQVFIIKDNGELLASSTGEKPFRLVNGENQLFLAINSSNPITRSIAKYLNQQLLTPDDFDKITKIYLDIHEQHYFLDVIPFQDFRGLEWLIVIAVPEDDFLGQIKANNQTTFLLCLGALLIALLMGTLTAGWVIKPIIKLNQASKNIAQGNFNQSLDFNRHDELGELAKSFNLMADQLQRSFSSLQENEYRLRQFLEAVPIGIAVHEPTGKIYYMNRKCQELLEINSILYSEKSDLSVTYEIYKAGTNQLYPTEESPILRALMGESIYLEDLEIHQQKKILPGEVWATPIYDDQGKIIYAIATFQEISQRKQTEKILADYNRTLEEEVKQRTAELAEAKEKAEVANRAKSIFIANMSHELRTPLNAILGFTQVMARSQTLSPEHRESIEIIHNSGEYLLTLINNILSITKMEAGKQTLNLNNFYFYSFLDDLEGLFYFRAESKGLTLNFIRGENLPQQIVADELKLRQVLINLLGNALKFTQVGGVSLEIEAENGLGENSLFLNFKVRDTGVGIAPEEFDQLFEEFSQTKSGKKAQEGTGLGLAISQQFVQLMGGKITVESQVGVGSCFQFKILVQGVDETVVQPVKSLRRVIGLEPNQPCYKILVVDDHKTNRQLLIKLLHPLGFQLQEATNGQEAIAIWNTWEPDVILMDIRMPVMNGYEATQWIKHQSHNNEPIIIAITASVLEQEKPSLLAVLCDDFIRKPFQEATLFEMLEKHLGVRYLYQEDAAETKLNSRTFTLTAESFNGMPLEWMEELYDASSSLDDLLVLELIQQIPPEKQALSEELKYWVHHFRLDLIFKALEQKIINS